jgi:hypothetical protein
VQVAYGRLIFPGLAAVTGTAGQPLPRVLALAGAAQAAAVAPGPPARVVRGYASAGVSAGGGAAAGAAAPPGGAESGVSAAPGMKTGVSRAGTLVTGVSSR